MEGGGLRKTNWEPEVAPKYRLWCPQWLVRQNVEKMVLSRVGEINGRWHCIANLRREGRKR